MRRQTYKDITLQVCIRQTQADAVRQRAEDNGMSVSHYLRWVISKELKETNQQPLR